MAQRDVAKRDGKSSGRKRCNLSFVRIDSSKIELMSDRCLIKNRTENLMRRRRIEEEVEFGVAPRVVDAHRRGLRIGPQRNQEPDRGSVGCGNRLRSQTCHYPVDPSARGALVLRGPAVPDTMSG